MTIKHFSSLCGCNAKTLRYYDNIGLLKPARVDPWTGYRYYDEEQALTFVKIRTLQEAGFSINEIRELLPLNDDAVYRAITEKIEEQERKLSQMKAIRQSYRNETMKMQDTINTYRETLRRMSMTCDPMEEFGISQEDYAAIVEQTADFIEPTLSAMQLLPEMDGLSPEEMLSGDNTPVENPLRDVANEVICERSGWEHVREALADLPLTEGETILYIELKKDRIPNPALTSVVMSLMVDRNKGRALSMTCNTVQTEGNLNRLWLLRKRGAR